MRYERESGDGWIAMLFVLVLVLMGILMGY